MPVLGVGRLVFGVVVRKVMQPLLHFGRDHVEATICSLHHRSVFVVPWCKPPLVANPPFTGLVGGFPSSAPGCWPAMGGWCRSGQAWDPHLVLADLLMEEEVVKLHCFRVIPGEGRLQAMQAMSLAPPQGAIGAGIGVFGRPLVPGPPESGSSYHPEISCVDQNGVAAKPMGEMLDLLLVGHHDVLDEDNRWWPIFEGALQVVQKGAKFVHFDTF